MNKSTTAPNSDAMALALAIRAVRVAISPDSTRPHLASLHVTALHDRIIVEGTDGYRAHRVEFDARVSVTDKIDALFLFPANIKLTAKTAATIKTTDGRHSLILTEGFQGAVTTIAETRELRFPPTDVLFVDAKKRGATATIFDTNGLFLSDACKAAALISGGRIHFRAGASPSDAYFIDAHSERLTFTAALMPMRT